MEMQSAAFSLTTAGAGSPSPLQVQCALAMVPKPAAKALPDLLPRIAASDETAVRDAVQRYRGLIWSLARQSDRDHTDDAVQEIFVDLWRAAARFDATKASEVTFVAMIARRRLIDRSRRRNRQPTSLPLTAAERVQDAGTSPDLAALVNQTVQALSHLRPEQREVVVLSTHGWSHGEIATKTGLPLGTVKAHVRRGLLAVRAALGTSPESGEP